MAPSKPRPPLRDRVLSHLQGAGSDSISGIARALAERTPDAPVHRLTVAGYLAALADEGVLREVERPPSKHYQVADPDRFQSLHQRVGRIIVDLAVPTPERPTLAVAVLQHLLGRPVFQEELHHAGFRRYGAGIQSVEVPEDERRDYRALFRNNPTLHLDIPHGDPLLHVPPGTVGTATLQSVLRRLVVAAVPGVDTLILDRDTGAAKGVQSRLDLEGPA